MARQASGSILVKELSGGRAFYLRFRSKGRRERVVLRERRGCDCGCGGGWDEPAARTELGDVLARVRAGVYERPKPPPAVAPGAEDPLFRDYAPAWLEAKIEGLYARDRSARGPARTTPGGCVGT
jgi:hypothetical protein